MRVSLRRLLCSALLLSLLCLSAGAQDAPPPVAEKDILAYLEQAIAWRRDITGWDLEPDTARETLLKETLQAGTKKLVQNSFSFARAAAALLPAHPDTDDEDESDQQKRHTKLLQRVTEINKRVADLQGRLDALAKAMHTAPAKQLATLRPKKVQLEGELKISQAQKDLLTSITGIFSAGDGEDAGGLLGKINQLSRGMTEPVPDASAPAPTTAVGKKTPPDNPEGMIGLLGALFSASGKSKQVDDMMGEAASLQSANQSLINALRNELQDAIKQGNTLADTPISNDAAGISDHHKALDALLAHYKQLSAAILPLGQVSVLLDAGRRDLKEWNGLLAQEWNSLFRRLMVHLGILGFSILVPVVLSALAQRAIERYVSDAKRKQQLKILRRVLFGLALLLVLMLNFFTEFGSLATFAGLLTAGLAVGLQSVLVSLTAHFFFFGRFGVRTGDRVTISGVTGDVIQVGMLRLYMMELVGEEGDLRPSGKIVAFPNSVLFNSTAFFKQVSGANYRWSDLTFLLDPHTDYAHAGHKIMQAVNAVYGEYKDTIEMQRSALEQSTRLSVKLPAPRSQINFTDAGLACVVHYPIAAKRAGEIHERLIQKLIEIFKGDPELKLVLSNPMRIEGVAHT